MRRALFALVALALIAGCFGGEEKPASRQVSAVGGNLTLGWDYAGLDVRSVGATLDALLLDDPNNGTVAVSAIIDGKQVDILFDSFAEGPDKAFMDGGIAFDLDEHGDTGVADASIPKIHALAAAWGKARVSIQGQPQEMEPWSAHLMVSRDTVRGTDGRIAKADGTTPYDTAAPGDARRIENDPQAILWVKHPQGETHVAPPVDVSIALACQGPQCSATQALLTEPGATSIDLNVSVFGPDASLPLGALGQGRLAIIDANGTELATLDIAPQPTAGAPTATGPISLDGAVFPISATLNGDGVFQVALVGSAQYTSLPFLVFTWDELTVTDG